MIQISRFINFSKNLLTKNKKELFISICFIFILICIQMFLPLFMRWIITEVETRQSYLFLIYCILIYALFLLIYNFVDMGRYMSLDILGGKILQNLREDVCNAITKSSYEKLMLIGKEKLKNILYMDTLNMYSGIACHSINIVANILLIVVFLIVSSCLNLKLTIVLLAASIIGFFISMFSRKPISNASMKVNKKMKEDNKTLNEYIDAIELAKTNELNDYFIKKNNNSLWNFINTSLKADKIQIFLKNLISEFHQVVSVTIAAILSMTMGNSTFGDIIYYMFVSNMVLDTSQNLESSIYALIKMIPSFENVDNILNMEKCFGEEKIGPIENIEFSNVSFYYEGNNKNNINQKNYFFEKGDVVRVTGVNGGGKSTFVKLITGLLSPKSGEILLNGVLLNNIKLSCLNNQILYVDQDEIILNDNVKNYIEAISGQEITDLQLDEMEKLVGFDSKIMEIKENGHSLSGGQRKKLLLIKLLLKYQLSSVIILDEIEAGLDEKTKSTVLKIESDIIKNKKDCIIFKITHETKNDNIYSKFIGM
ncbi:ABC transporter ATP-binding protein [Sedimentibacter sp. zth1]|uniref:ATP-binding cassette domain-containing protein n=1 Tax=Sedimentibacter sp. zth1 TaxID=2816908 RepID=UPI001A91CE77|nr:ABC transporter ATP-binding protein [Sedimentibacter sp. zth1]QSX07255.1 ABC transporter ATP-binding protein [Sedimentibacter sp. zth1]